jgi:hypothetical protein
VFKNNHLEKSKPVVHWLSEPNFATIGCPSVVRKTAHETAEIPRFTASQAH